MANQIFIPMENHYGFTKAQIKQSLIKSGYKNICYSGKERGFYAAIK